MADAEQKLTALKKAYADVLLNMSKEAAARVMASERRAVRYQHELMAAKEEAIRMLMRLKQMMDYKINEGKAASLHQQSKIEELEAQLQEAEDIVKDLREELAEAHSDLERAKNVDINEAKDECSREIMSLENRIYSYQPQDEYAMPLVSYIGNRDLPSIISRGKDAGLYKNGCTQRIRACERKLCLSVESDKSKDENNERGIVESKNTCKSTVSGFSNLQSFKKRKRTCKKRKNLRPLENKVKDEGLNEKMALLVEGVELAKSMDTRDGDIASENLEMNSAEATEVIPSGPTKERVIKYTFQRRKLKRRALSGCEVNVPLEIEKKIEDERKDEHKVETVNSSLLGESTRDSRRLAQVARQLLSLSEKKWD